MVEYTAKDFVEKEGKVSWNHNGAKSEPRIKKLPGSGYRKLIKENNLVQFRYSLFLGEIAIETMGALHNQNVMLLGGGLKIDSVHPEPEDFNEASKQVTKLKLIFIN